VLADVGHFLSSPVPRSTLSASRATSPKMAMRGLTQFIGDIRNCPNKEEERKRVDKEMANIRKHFKEATKLTAYSKKKYVWKMLYIYVLGYEVDFGHMEALNLITCPGYPEKTVGYLACVLLLSETNEFLRLIINSVKNDLMSNNDEIQAIALACVANVGGREFAETLTIDVQRILLSPKSRPQAKKKAALCMLRLLRKYPEGFGEDGVGGIPEFKDRLLDLLEDTSLGVVTATTSLLLGLVSHSPSLWVEAVPKCCKLLSKLTHPNAINEYGAEYVYHKTVNPWLQVKILRLLQYYPPPEKEEVQRKLEDALSKIINETTMQKHVNANNAAHAVLFEAVNYVIHLETNKTLTAACVNMLGQRITSAQQPNYRYLSLDAMQRMSHLPDAAEQFKKHREMVIASLRDNDVSLRRRALDVLYSMCDNLNSEQVVGELLDYLKTADFSIREELVLRVAILSERFSPNLKWYVDTILKLMMSAGDHVGDNIWMRVVQIVTNHDELQLYAAETCFRALSKEPVHESMTKCGGYVLGEFGHLIAHRPASSPEAQLALLRDRFHQCEQPNTRQLLLTALAKLLNVHPSIKDAILPILKRSTTTIDAELQQRAIEYLALAQPGREGTLEAVLDVMPNFPERESILTKQIKERERASTTDRTAAQVKAGGNKEEVEPEPVEVVPVELDAKSSKTSTSVPSAARPGQSPPAAAAGPAQDLLDFSDPAPPKATSYSGSVDLMDDLLGGPAAPAAKAPVASAGLMDDIFGGPSAPPPAAAAAPVDMFGDLLSGPSTPAPVAVSPQKVMDLVCLAIVADQGTIYEDPAGLCVAAQIAVQGNVCKVLLRYKNSGGSPIQALSMHVETIQGVETQAQPAPDTLPPGGQGQHQVQLNVSAVFAAPPKLTYTFTQGGVSRTLETFLPITPCRFQAPVTCTKEQYFGVWGKITGPPNEVAKVFKSKKPIVRKDFEDAIAALRYSVLVGVDPNPNNIVGAARASVAGQDMFCVIRIETEPAQQAIKLTIKTSSPALSEVTRLVMMTLFSA